GIAVLYRRWPNKDQPVPRRDRPLPPNPPSRDPRHRRPPRQADRPPHRHRQGPRPLLRHRRRLRRPSRHRPNPPAPARIKPPAPQPPWRDPPSTAAPKTRGEMDLTQTPVSVLGLPFDLMRHDMVMNRKPLPRARINSIVDGLFLPPVQRP